MKDHGIDLTLPKAGANPPPSDNDANTERRYGISDRAEVEKYGYEHARRCGSTPSRPCVICPVPRPRSRPATPCPPGQSVIVAQLAGDSLTRSMNEDKAIKATAAWSSCTSQRPATPSAEQSSPQARPSPVASVHSEGRTRVPEYGDLLVRATPESGGVRTEIEVANTYERDTTYSVQISITDR
ncbi:hypothetical protein GCM10010303_13850 [Streptomyces purpurascens]|nr:hypothetical protein GCM10010303_13850 [Streptomyces purpurascens]